MSKNSRDVDNDDEGKAVEVDLDSSDDPGDDSSVTITIPTE